MSGMGPFDIEAKIRIADRERAAAPLRVGAEGRRERLGWERQRRLPLLIALARSTAANARRIGVRVVRSPSHLAHRINGDISRAPHAPRTPAPPEPSLRPPIR